MKLKILILTDDTQAELSELYALLDSAPTDWKDNFLRMTNITRTEMETIINFNEKEPTAAVYTYNGAFTRKLDKLCTERPEEVKRTAIGQHGGITYEVPKKWIKINASVIFTPEQRTAMAERAKANLVPKTPTAVED